LSQASKKELAKKRLYRKEVNSMAQSKRFKAKKDLKLDCGHTIKAGESFVVTRVFSCEEDAKRVGFPKAEQTPQPKPE
jgi:hypothetical protein